MIIKTSISLNDKQSAAFLKRVTGNATQESLVQSIVEELSQKWADDDYSSTANALTQALKNQPQEVLDGIIAQLSNFES